MRLFRGIMRLIQIIFYGVFIVVASRAYCFENEQEIFPKYIEERINNLSIEIYLDEMDNPLLLDEEIEETYAYKKGYLDALLEIQSIRLQELHKAEKHLQ